MSGLFLPLPVAEKKGRAAGRVLFRGLAMLLVATGLAIGAGGLMVPAKAALAQILLDRAFTRSLAAGRPIRPWGWADMAPVARLKVERLGVGTIILSGGSGQAMAFGPTQLLPGGGDAAAPVTVLAAHRDTHFAFVKDLKQGDRLDLEHVDGRHVRYRITGFQTLRWDEFAIPSAPARPLLALTTCYPFDAMTQGPWRRIVWAEAIS